MILAVFAPQTALHSMFGEGLVAPIAEVVVRSWGFLIFLMGVLLIYGAFNSTYRNLALGFVGISKLAFITLVITFGSEFICHSRLTILLDSVFVVVFASYLIMVKRSTSN
jgi:hypothetical protein